MLGTFGLNGGVGPVMVALSVPLSLQNASLLTYATISAPAGLRQGTAARRKPPRPFSPVSEFCSRPATPNGGTRRHGTVRGNGFGVAWRGSWGEGSGAV